VIRSSFQAVLVRRCRHVILRFGYARCLSARAAIRTSEGVKAHRIVLLASVATLVLGRVTCPGQVTVVSSYTQDFDTLGTALPAGWAVWLSSTSTSNGTAFPWNTAQVANNTTPTETNYFRNLPGASQTWSAGLSGGSDRALGWRAGDAASRDGSITFTFSDTADWSFDSLSFQLFTPNNSGAAATFQFQYQVGSSGTFTNFNPVMSYTSDTAQNPLIVTSISLTSGQLAAISNRADQVTLRLDNIATTGTSWNTVALDNFSYSASAIPEPSTYAAIVGAAALLGAGWQRQRRRRTLDHVRAPGAD
jgi:trimeric autotransporter adhesin